jgi:multidrug transporter EmrE-like cation transporter
MKYGIALALALTFNATANLMMKFGIERHKAAPLGPSPDAITTFSALATNWVLITGLILFAVNVLLYTFALKGFSISTAYPIMVSGGFAIIAVVAWQYLGEHLSAFQWTGVGLILVGVWLVAREMRVVAA